MFKRNYVPKYQVAGEVMPTDEEALAQYNAIMASVLQQSQAANPIPKKQSFSQFYRNAIKNGKAGDVVEWNGKKILLDPRDFGGQQQRTSQPSQRNQQPSSQGNSSPDFNWLQNRRTVGNNMILDLPRSTTQSSRSNTPFQSKRPASQEQNTARVNGDKSFWSHPASYMLEHSPDLSTGNPLIDIINPATAGRSFFESVKRLGSGIGEGSDYEDSPWYQNPLFDAAQVFGLGAAGKGMLTEAMGAKLGNKLASKFPLKETITPYIPQGQRVAGELPPPPATPRWSYRQPAPQTQGPVRYANAPRQPLLNNARPVLSKAEVAELNRINKSTQKALATPAKELERIMQNIKNLTPTQQKKVMQINKKLDKQGFQMGGGIPLFENDNYFDDYMTF